MNLDELDALYVKATPGKWVSKVEESQQRDYARITLAEKGSYVASVCEVIDGAYIAALHNAYPALSARIRELEKERDLLVAWKTNHMHGECNGFMRGAFTGTDVPKYTPECVVYKQERDALHRQVASLRDVKIADLEKRLRNVSEACDYHYKQEAELRREQRFIHEIRNSAVWYWQGDGDDYPESLGCPVVMRPEHLRELLAKANAHQSPANKTGERA
jgi:hypothetical protein